MFKPREGATQVTRYSRWEVTREIFLGAMREGDQWQGPHRFHLLSPFHITVLGTVLAPFEQRFFWKRIWNKRCVPFFPAPRGGKKAFSHSLPVGMREDEKLLQFLLNNRLLLWSCQPGSLWLYKMDSINKRLRTTSHKDPDWDVSERLFGDVCTGLARSYVWLKSILFSTIKTDLTYDILSLLNKARSMPWAASLDLPLSQVFPRSGKARNCFYI